MQPVGQLWKAILLSGLFFKPLLFGASMEPFIFTEVMEPFGISRNNDGTFFIADFRNSHRVMRFDLQTKRLEYLSAQGFISEYPPQKAGSEPGQFNMPHSISFSPEGEILITEFGGQRLQLFSKNGAFKGVFQRFTSSSGDQDETRFQKHPSPIPSSVSGVLAGPATATYGPDGAIYIADYTSHSIQKLSPDGTFLGKLGATPDGKTCQGWHKLRTAPSNELGGLNFPHMVTFDLDGNLYVADTANHRIQKFDAKTGKCRGWLGAQQNGNITETWQHEGMSAPSKALGAFSSPTSVQVSQKYLIVGEHGNSRVQRFRNTGQFAGCFGTTKENEEIFKWKMTGESVESSLLGGFSKIYDAKLYGNLLVVADSGNRRVQFLPLVSSGSILNFFRDLF